MDMQAAPVEAAPSRVGPLVRQAADSARQRLFFSTLVLALMLLLCAPFFVDLVARGAPRAQDGAISYKSWGGLTAPVELRGQWRLVWREGAGLAPGTTGQVAVPDQWSRVKGADGRLWPATGIASLELSLRDLAPGRYILHVPIIFGANRLYVNGRLAGTHGGMGRDAATTRATVRSHEVTIDADGAPVVIRFDLASFVHRDTGFGEPPVLGLETPMRRWIALEWAKDLLFHASLLLFAANTFIAFLFRRQDRASLYASLATLLAIPGTGVISYDNILMMALPGLSFPAMLVLQYLCTTLVFLFFVAYVRALYPAEWPRRWFLAVQAITGGYLLAQIAAFLISTRTASLVAVYSPIIAAVAFLSVLAVVFRAARRGRDGAPVFLVGTFIFTVLLLNATVSWSRLVPSEYLLGPQTLPLGMLMLLFSLFVIQAERWSIAIISAEQVNEDLRELLEVSSAITSEMRLETLLARIVEVTSRMLKADRSSLLLHDPKNGELWSLVAEGINTREIRFDSKIGLAGHAFTTGAVVNVTDVYADPRFHQAMDLATGYKTRTMLTMPITARDGRRLGVMQALNRRDGRPFTDSDAKRMGAFAAQAAIAIDNATLFSEVVSSRNYNESILRSMSTGVVTLDRDAEISTLNDAACRILHIAPEAVAGMNARTVLSDSNPWLLSEIDAVSATGEPKLLLEVEMTTGDGTVISANLSIVPLMSEGEKVGLLILIDDISEGKRLQGAMRRFMSQDVVDQVMAQRDDILFGTACEASVLFADIRNFTSMAESLTPRQTVDMLNEVFTELFEAVAASDGVLDKFIGDAIMAVYGAPISTGRDPHNAVSSAIEMLRLLDGVNQGRVARGQAALRIGLGISTGEVVAGTIGSPKRMDYTVIGDSVNLAARLQNLTKAYGVDILICEHTAAAVTETQRLRELDLIVVRGRVRPATVFQVVPAATPQPVLDAYRLGRARFLARDWTQAIAAFEDALVHDPCDQPAMLMLERARALQADPPGDDWNGVWQQSGASR